MILPKSTLGKQCNIINMSFMIWRIKNFAIGRSFFVDTLNLAILG